MHRKLIAGLLAGVFVITSLCACSKKERKLNESRVGSEGPWYEMNYFPTTEYGECRGWTGDDSIIDYDGESVTVVERYQIGYQDEVTFGTSLEEKDDVFNISKYSLKEENYGELIGYYDIMSGDIMDYEMDYYYYVMVSKYFPNGEDIDILVNETDPDTYENGYKIYKVNLESGELISERDLDLSALGPSNMVYFQDFLKTDDGYLVATTIWGETEIKIHTFDNDFNYVDTVAIELDPSLYITYVGDVNIVDSNNYYFIVYDVDDNEMAMLYNNETGEITDQPVMYSYGRYNFMDVENVYSSDSFSVKSYNMLTGEEEVVVDYNNCIVDRSIVGDGLNIAYSDDERMLASVFSDTGFNIVELKAVDTDPYEGKTALSAAFLDNYIGDTESHAIYQYNMSSDDSYIYVDPRYNMTDHMDYDSDADYVTIQRDAALAISNQLMVDIMAGEGPDIIFGAYSYSQFNNPNVLIDLNPLIDADSDFNRDDYFSAIFSSETGNLYQLPYAANLESLYGSEEAASYVNGGYGVTLDDFATLVSDFNNGLNPMQGSYLSKEEIFIRMFNWNHDKFYSNGSISIDRDYFEQIAAYVSEIPEMSFETYFERSEFGGMDVYYESYVGAASLNHEQLIMGLPSPDGLAPILRSDFSVAITASCPNPDLAWNFVKVLFSEESQSNVFSGAVLRTARAAQEQRFVDERIRSEEADQLFGFLWGEPSVYSDDAVEITMAALDAATSVYASDADIDAIIFEEIQAYFAGDKTVDEVIDLIENRAQLVIDERG